jgi:hypothetical protein
LQAAVLNKYCSLASADSVTDLERDVEIQTRDVGDDGIACINAVQHGLSYKMARYVELTPCL